MKIKLIKNWSYYAPYAANNKKSWYKAGLILHGNRVDYDGIGKNSDVKAGDFYIPHFYCYGLGIVIPKKYFEVVHRIPKTHTHIGKRMKIRDKCEKCDTKTNWTVKVSNRNAYWCGCD